MSDLITVDTSTIRHRNFQKMVPAINDLDPGVNSLQKEEAVCDVEDTSEEINFSTFRDEEQLLQEIKKINRSSSLSEECESDDAAMLVQTIDPSEEKVDETALSIAVQVFVPFLIAGFGTVGAGLVLDIVQVSNFLFIV